MTASNLLPVPGSRVIKNQSLQKNVKRITAMKTNIHLNMSLLVAAETATTLSNKVRGLYKNPQDYLYSLVDYSKSLDQGQKVAIVTGANSGIGYVTAKYLYKAGYYVILACRNEQKALEAIEQIKSDKNNEGELKFIQFNASSLRSVSEFANEFVKLNKKLDLLVNNAGIMMVPYGLTEDGIENQIATNFLSHYFLTDQLLPYLNNNSKIINLSSLASFFASEFSLKQLTDKEVYSPVGNYSQSKLAMTMFTYYLHSRLQGSNITVYSVHPGLVKTNLYTSNILTKASSFAGKATFKDAESGTFTTLRCALLPPPESHGVETLYYADELPFYPPASALDQNKVKELIGWAKDTIISKGFNLNSGI